MELLGGIPLENHENEDEEESAAPVNQEMEEEESAAPPQPQRQAGKRKQQISLREEAKEEVKTKAKKVTKQKVHLHSLDPDAPDLSHEEQIRLKKAKRNKEFREKKKAEAETLRAQVDGLKKERDDLKRALQVSEDQRLHSEQELRLRDEVIAGLQGEKAFLENFLGSILIIAPSEGDEDLTSNSEQEAESP